MTQKLKRYLGWSVLAAMMAIPLAATGCAVGPRHYDPYYRDYHRWNRRDRDDYRRWEAERHERHRDFSRRDHRQREEYWRWRHMQHDNDRR